MNKWLSLITAFVIGALSAAILVVRANSNDVLARAATALKAQPSYRTVFSIETKTTSSVGIQMQGAVDQHTHVGRFVMRFTFPGLPHPVTCSVLTTADAVFIPVAAKHRAQFGGKSWVESSAAGLLPIQGFGTKGFDPTSFANINHVHEIGADTVRGVPTTTYNGTLHIDKTKFTNDNPALTSAVPNEVPVELWVSKDHLIRKFSDSFTTRVGTISVDTTTTFEYFDFGVPVKIAAPPAALVDHGDARAAISACIS